MRKFKIKNRRKRKYVKKQDFTASFAHLPELTLGIVPMLLVGIAFFATFLISNPQVISNAVPNVQVSMPEFMIPQITLPTIELEFEMPSFTFPEISLPAVPQLTMPELSLPVITLPNFQPFVSERLSATAAFGSVLVQYGNSSLQTSGQFLASFYEQTGNIIIAGSSAVGQFFTWAAVTLWDALTTVFTTVSNVLITGYSRIGVLVVQTVQLLAMITVQTVLVILGWLESIVTAIINGIAAFFWFLGTPFRALGHYTEEASIAMRPLFNYLGDTFNRSINDLDAGVNTLEQSTYYVGNSVESQK